MNTPMYTFDGQAAEFDRRAGLPATSGKAVADILRRLTADAPTDATAGILLDLGAGTGEVSLELADLPMPYIGLDRSASMLALFQRKLTRRGLSTPLLLQADGNRPWPIDDGSVRLLFSSRAAHLLRSDHFVEESVRVLDPRAAWVVLGSVRRAKDSLRDALRREMRRLLEAEGFTGRGGRKARRGLFEALERRGGTLLPAVDAVSWSVRERAKDSLDAWRGKEGLAGVDVDASTRDTVLDHLETWAHEYFGDLESEHPSKEFYRLEVMQFADQKPSSTMER